MKIVVIFLSLFLWAASAPYYPPPPSSPPETAPNTCLNGTVISHHCCIESAHWWITESVPASQIHSIVVSPATCANPSFCGIMQYYEGVKPDERITDHETSTMAWGQSARSCGAVDFIVCRNTGKSTIEEAVDWRCYGKMQDMAILMKFTQPLHCDYERLPNGELAVKVGSCVINQETFLGISPDTLSKPYAELSTPEVLEFRPFLNLAAIGAVSRQTGINKVIRTTDTWLETAYLPPYPNDDARFEAVRQALVEEDSHTAIYTLVGIACICGLLVLAAWTMMMNLIQRNKIKALKHEILNLQEQLPAPEGVPMQDLRVPMLPVQLQFIDIPDKV